MADPDHVLVLKKGVDAWNAWRAAHPEIRPNLSSIDLADDALLGWPVLATADAATRIPGNGAPLRCIDLRGADLRNANLSNADLTGTLLGLADLTDACLDSASLFCARVAGARFIRTRLNRADLSGVDLSRCIGLSNEQLETAVGNFHSVRLPHIISRMPESWTKCDDDAIPLFCTDERVFSNQTDSTTPKDIVAPWSRKVSSLLRIYCAELATEIKKKTQGYLATALLGIIAVVFAEAWSWLFFKASLLGRIF